MEPITSTPPRAVCSTDELLTLDFEVGLSRPTQLLARALPLHFQMLGADAFYWRLRTDYLDAVLDDFECAHGVALAGAARLYLLDVAVAYYCVDGESLP